MIKVFTIIFLLFYIFRVFKNGFLIDTSNKLTEDLKKFNDIKDDSEKKEFIVNRLVPIITRLSFLIILTLPITIAELIYIFSAVQYGNKLITIGFIIWWFLLLIIGTIKNKLKKDKFEKVKRFSLWRLFVNIIDVAYFGYMYYVLFLN